MAETLDIFRGDGFSMTSLIKGIDQKPFKPNFVTSLGLFRKEPIRTETVTIESRKDGLSLIPLSQRGDKAFQRKTEKRNLRHFSTFRLAQEETVFASELQFVRQMDTANAMMEAKKEVARRLGGGNTSGVGILDNMDLTAEFMQMAALQGYMMDSDGSIIYDYAAEFGITPLADVNVIYSGIGEGDFRIVCNNLIRDAARADSFHWSFKTRYMALCSDEFFDNLSKIPEVRQQYRNAVAGAGNVVEGGSAFGEITYGNIRWVNYRGTDDQSTIAIPANTARLVPIDGNDIFSEVLAPGEKFAHIGKVGEAVYPEVKVDSDDEWIKIKARKYPLYINKAPKLVHDIAFT